MIDKREILEAASSFSLLPNVVEKDYVLGWILAGINAHDELSETWVFRGVPVSRSVTSRRIGFPKTWILRCAMRTILMRNSCGLFSRKLLPGSVSNRVSTFLPISLNSTSTTIRAVV